MNKCPLNGQYCYTGRCQITTCQHQTSVTVTGCLLQDRKERHDKISDAEVLHYKIKPRADEFGSKSMDVKFASYVRKVQIGATRSNMALYLYVNFVLGKYKPNPKFDYEPGINKIIDQTVSSFPLQQDYLPFAPWMLFYLANPKVFKEFLGDQNRMITEKLDLVNVLGSTPGKYKNLCLSIKQFAQAKRKHKKAILKLGDKK